MRIQSRLPIADQFANAVLDLRASKTNASKLGALYKAVVGNDIDLPANVSMREFRRHRRALADSYLNKVHSLNAEAVNKPNNAGVAKFDLSNLYWLITKAMR